jgi:hypothetical protein
MRAAVPLSAQQVNYFKTFGFVKVPGLFREDVDEIVAGFEAVFANELPTMETYEPLHGEQRRLIIMGFVDKDARLERLKTDPRVVGVVSSLLGDEFVYAQSDGNLFDCESHWHSDMYGAPLEYHHVKLSFYLDPLRADSGAIRVIPGTHHYRERYALDLRKRFKEPANGAFGVDPRDIPSVPLETDPGDLVVWDFRTIHASFHGGIRRRLFSMNYRDAQARQPAEA